MDLPNVEGKLREARFFLESMRKAEEKWPTGDCEREPFVFYLSAFLSASWSVRDRMFADQKHVHPPPFSSKTKLDAWYANWRDKLQQRERSVYRVLSGDRSAEIHGRGSRAQPKGEEVSLSDLRLRQPPNQVVFSPPPFFDEVPVDLTIERFRYGFNIDGVWCKATDACAEYLKLLEQVVAKFQAGLPLMQTRGYP